MQDPLQSIRQVCNMTPFGIRLGLKMTKYAISDVFCGYVFAPSVGSSSICSSISNAVVLSLRFIAAANSNPSFIASGIRSFTLERSLTSFLILSPRAQDFQLSNKFWCSYVRDSLSLYLQSVSSIFQECFPACTYRTLS